MSSPLQSLIASGTKLWLDSVDPDLVAENRKLGATGATSNPIIVADLIKTGRFDDTLQKFLDQGLSDEDIAWAMTDDLVKRAQAVFKDVWDKTVGNDGYVSFELDPLLDDAEGKLSHDQRVLRYVELGKRWYAGHSNRMIKVPATAAGLAALEELAAAGVPLNVTLIFTRRQYEQARDAIHRGFQRRYPRTLCKSVYSIFVSRIDVWTRKHLPQLSKDAQGLVGVVNAKRVWSLNRDYWAAHPMPLQQEMIFASTGAKLEGQPEDFYIEHLAGADIQTNPPATNEALQNTGKTYTRRVNELPPRSILDEIDRTVDLQAMEDALMEEGLAKFADPFRKLLALIADKRKSLANV